MGKDNIKPSMVLTLICVISCCLLVFAYEATFDDNTGKVTEELTAAFTDIYGEAEALYIELNDDGTVYQPNGVTAVLVDAKGDRAYEITADGYERGGIHVLVGLDENGEVKGISFIAIKETPGLGTKVQDSSFLSQFTALSYAKLPAESAEKPARRKAVWGSREQIDSLKAEATPFDSSFSLDVITGATYSSEGVYNAVRTALEADGERGAS
ncbi:MAG: FMN-binding protein [Oscillospiraceae bacterium]|nr:FMN-binding protein [Oscillospiraceae bacterium]